MRLIRLRVKNIASLRGEHEIDFQEIQRGSALFAITGETGAGKSSVLNSIGLALYGEIYKKTLVQNDVVTLGEKEGQIELIFQVKNKYYLADWRARVLKQNGEPYSTPQSPSRNLYQLEGTEFNSPKNISNKTCAELLNLDFEQFCRCIILNQGEFAKFLNSSFKDRRDILEKLYPGEMLDNVSRELELEKKSLEKSKHDLEIELHTLRGDSLSGEILKEQKRSLEEELAYAEAALKKIESLDYHFTSLLSYHAKFNDNELKKDRIRAELDNETTRYNHLLKTGEALQENDLKAKKAQDTELPRLQSLLLKEENLNQAAEMELALRRRREEVQKNARAVIEKISVKESEEAAAHGKLTLALKDLNHPLEVLRAARPHFEGIFDTFGEKELLQEEVRGKRERFTHLEASGKELKMGLEEALEKLNQIPSNIKDLEAEIAKKRASLQLRIDWKQRSEIKSQELELGLQKNAEEKARLLLDLERLKVSLKEKQDEVLPLEATLKLQEVFSAKELCVSHALTNNLDHCPVCDQKVPDTFWTSLSARIMGTDLKSMKDRLDEGLKLINKRQNDLDLGEAQIKNLDAEEKKKKEELSELKPSRDELLPTLEDLDHEMTSIKKQSWELDALKKDINSKQTELQKTREQYFSLKNDLRLKEEELSLKITALSTLAEKINHFIPDINRDSIRDLRIEVKNLNSYLELEAALEKMIQDKIYLLEQKTKLLTDFAQIEREEELQSGKARELREELKGSLGDRRASDLIQELHQRARSTNEAWQKHSEELRKQQLVLKDAQARLSQLDELTKDYDLHYTKELHGIREEAKTELKLSSAQLLTSLRQINLSISASRDLFIPIRDLLLSERERAKESTNQTRMNFASASARLSDWEKLQDKIFLLELKAKDISQALDRKMRLFEVLGRDELRTFVLSLVEERLIQQTNEELQKLCLGRYQIVHQHRSLKLAPEFFIQDKFREGGRRKVSTLSGGETFMVSLAMALGLAEMTRGQAEIDSLFIDEGFGTLDQESLEDVLDMLQQIQTRGLMVGVISHIKTLTNALAVNLVLNKKQDGTSSISLQYN